MNNLFIQTLGLLFLNYMIHQIYYSKKEITHTINYNAQEENLIDQVSMIFF